MMQVDLSEGSGSNSADSSSDLLEETQISTESYNSNQQSNVYSYLISKIIQKKSWQNQTPMKFLKGLKKSEGINIELFLDNLCY